MVIHLQLPCEKKSHSGDSPDLFLDEVVCVCGERTAGKQGLTCQAGPEFGRRQRTAAHPPWKSGSSGRPPTSLYSTHSLAGLRREGVVERWMDGEDKV